MTDPNQTQEFPIIRTKAKFTTKHKVTIALALAGTAIGSLVIGVMIGIATPDLSKVLPYYHRSAPAWCHEDMACWIGSTADSRTDLEIRRSLTTDLSTAGRN